MIIFPSGLILTIAVVFVVIALVMCAIWSIERKNDGEGE